MTQPSLFLFGRPRLEYEGEQVDITNRKALALLAYLAATREHHSRDRLSALFWPEYDQTRARANLRHALYLLNKTPIGPFIQAAQERIGLETGEVIWVDVLRFQELLSNEKGQGNYSALSQAVDLYQWDFLDDFYLPDSSEFEDWAVVLRQQLRQKALESLGTLTSHFIDKGDYKAAQSTAWRQLEIDNLRDTAYRGLMTALSRSGQRTAALAQFETLRTLLDEELGVLPSAETTALYEGIRAESLPPARPTRPDLTTQTSHIPVFLFTDIEGSTPLWDRHRQAMLSALQKHNSILEEGIRRFGGRVLELRGDGVKAVFEGGQPLECVLFIQRELGRVEWGPVGEVRVRMGLHGVPVEREGVEYFRQGDLYFGPVLNAAARIMDAAWGGQILVSGALREALPLPEGASWQDFGAQGLKGLDDPVRIYGLLHPELSLQEFPPLRIIEPGEPGTSALVPLSTPGSPYRGLFSFREEDAPFFFGRETFSDLLLQAVREHTMTTVVGPSGSGKSSVVHAGLLPHLRQQGNWLNTGFRPGSRPFHALSTALISILEPELRETDLLVETNKLASALIQEDITLFDIVQRILDKHSEGHRLSLVGDQFEELYTLVPEPELRSRFIENLLEVVYRDQYRPKPIFSLVLTLRADFLGQALTHRPFADAIHESSLILGPMTQGELRRAIVNPAQKMGASFEPGLVNRILEDVGHEPGNLPLLEFALSTLWERQEGMLLTHTDYESIERVDGALSRHADQVFEGLDSEEQEISRRIFIQVVRPGEGTEDTRRLATREEIGVADWGLVQRLADARLLVTGRDATGRETVEVVHEALIRGWGRLRDWMGEDRAFRVWQDRLRSAIRGWEASEKDEGGLLRGLPLAEAEDWLVRRLPNISLEEQVFIEASVALRARRQEERERQLAEQERLRVARERLQRRISLGLSVGLVIAVALTVFAGWQWSATRRAQTAAEAERDRADAQAQIALERLSSQLAAQVLTSLDDQLDLALLLSIEAFRTADTPEARGSLQIALSHNPQFITRLRAGDVSSVAFSPDGGTLAAGGDDQVITLWDVATALPLSPLLTGHESSVLSLAYSPDGALLASGGGDKQIFLWDVDPGSATFGQPVTRLSGSSFGVAALAFSPDGRRLASGGCGQRSDFGICQGGEIRLWEVATGQPVTQPLTEHQGQVMSVAFSPDGRSLASGSTDGMVILWDVDPGSGIMGQPLVPPLSAHRDDVWSVAFSPNGRVLASGSSDRSIILWDVDPSSASFGQPLIPPLTSHKSTVFSVAFSPDGETLASTGRDRTIFLWNTADDTASFGGELGALLTDHGDPVRSLAFSPDGRTLATASEDQTIALWDITGDHPLGERLRVPGDVALGWVIVEWTDRSLAWGNAEGDVLLWDLGARDPVGKLLSGHEGKITDIYFSPDGKLLATGDAGGTLYLWDVDTGQEIGPPLTGQHLDLSEHCNAAFTIRPLNNYFSLDNQILYAGGESGAITLLDTATGQPAGTPLAGHDGPVLSADISQDGKILASGGADGGVVLWDVDRGSDSFGQPLGPPLTGHQSGVWALLFSPDGKKLSSGSEEVMILWDVDTDSASFGQPIGDPIRRCLGLFSRTEVFQTYVAFQPDGGLAFWDMETMGLLDQPLSNYRASDFNYSMSPDESALATAGSERTVVLWDLATGQPRFPPLAGHEAPLTWIEFSPDGGTLATADTSGTIILWDAATGQALGSPLVGHSTSVIDHRFSPDGSLLASGGELSAGEIFLWDTSTGQSIGQPLTGHKWVNWLIFIPDGRTLVSTSSDGSAFYWDIDVESWLVRACRRANRNLTLEEWRQFFSGEPYRPTCPDLPSPSAP